MTQTIDIAANLSRVRERMEQAAVMAGRDPGEIALVAVSKTHPAAAVQEALAAGQCDFGENLVEEAWAKLAAPDAPLAGTPEARLHLIGPIQSRKAALAIACRPVLIHAVDRLKIARRLDRFASEAGVTQDVLLEVNVSGEESKFGFTPDGLRRDVEALLGLPNLAISGLMTIPPYDPDPELARPHFAALRALQEELASEHGPTRWLHLSMGMSHDFEVAIAEGATLVRVGTAIFGTRDGST
ncbi:MAG: YggS family pyridoxal phosphate-dependent enzyme [Caldilineales bacterium]